MVTTDAIFVVACRYGETVDLFLGSNMDRGVYSGPCAIRLFFCLYKDFSETRYEGGIKQQT
jgi:hypothetical protein